MTKILGKYIIITVGISSQDRMCTALRLLCRYRVYRGQRPRVAPSSNFNGRQISTNCIFMLKKKNRRDKTKIMYCIFYVSIILPKLVEAKKSKKEPELHVIIVL